MADVTVSADPSYGPPRNVIVAHATGGSILESCEVTRIVGGAEEPIRRQPIVGVSDVTLYDYEAPYDRSAVYRIQGLERNTIASSWTGNKDASTSQLSQDGSVIATNLVTSPKPLAAGWGQSSVTMTDTPDGLAVSAHDHDADEYAVILNIPCNPDTTYHIVAELMRLDGPTWINGPLFAVEWTTTNGIAAVHMAIGGIKQGILQTDFTTQPTATNISIRLYAPLYTTQQTVWRHIGLYTAADWSAMQARGITWFDGDSFQASTTTQYDESSSPVTLSPDSGWLIHPGNPAKSMRLPLGHITGMGDTTRRSNATRHDILGARYPIYTNPGPRYSRELSMKLRTRTADDENMLDALLDDQTPILFNPRGVDASRLNLNPMYLQVGDVTAARYAQSLYPTSDSPQHWRDWTLPCTQVDSPAVSQQAVGWTYAQLLNDNTRYQSIIISYKDYASLQAHSVKDGQ